MKVDGTIDKFNARLVDQYFRKKYRIHNFNTYAPIAMIFTISLLVAIASSFNLVIHQVNVKTSFLNGNLKEEVYMKQPKEFIIKGQDSKVRKLVKSLYGLTQEPKLNI